MVRLLISAGVRLLANAVGLFVAQLLLGDDMTVTTTGFVVAVVIFTVVELLLDPLLTMVAVRHVRALRGSVSVLTTFLALLVTTLLTEGLQIHGVSTWVLATLIVWLASLLASLILPLLIGKRAVEKVQS